MNLEGFIFLNEEWTWQPRDDILTTRSNSFMIGSRNKKKKNHSANMLKLA